MKNREYGIKLTKTLKQVTESIAQKKSAKKSTRKVKEAILKPVNEYTITNIMHISTYITSCWAKLRKYYSLIN